MNESIAVLGASGHAKVVISMLQALGYKDLIAFDDDRAKIGSTILSVPVVGDIKQWMSQRTKSAVLAIGDNDVRQRISREISTSWLTIVHPSAVVHHSVRLGQGTVVMAGVVIQPDVVVGQQTIINTGVSLDHDCRVGDYSHVCPGSTLAGSVQVDEGAFIGSGCVILPGIVVGAWSRVGAGSVCTKNIPARVTAFGSPARVR